MPEVAKHLEISEATYHRWRVQYGGLKADDAKRVWVHLSRRRHAHEALAFRGGALAVSL